MWNQTRVLPLLSCLCLLASPALASEPLLRNLRNRGLEAAAKAEGKKTDEAKTEEESKPKDSGYSPQKAFLLDDVKCRHVDLFAPPADINKDASGRRLNQLSYAQQKSSWNRRTESEPALDPFTDDETGDDAVPESTTDDTPVPESKQPPRPHELSDIPLDPIISYGELENGLQYYIVPNDDPPGKLEFRLHIDAGANFETDPFDGGAHFLEHMMFQTTRTHPDGDLIPAFQRLGLGFGIHVNAYTTVDETVYFLGLPNTDNDTIAESMNWMRDVLDGALIEEEEIEAERGVVISELEARDSIGRRLTRELYAWVLPDNLLSDRFVLGTESTIATMERPLFEEYYGNYYVPRRATFIAAGDINVAEMEALIEEYFGSTADAGDRGDPVDYGPVPVGQGLQTNVFQDEELVGAQITINTMVPQGPLPDTEAQRIEDMKISIANTVVSNRLFDLGSPSNSTIFSGAAGFSHLYDFAQIASISVYPKEGLWKEAVSVMEQEVRRFLEHGFTQFEVDEAKASRLNAYQQRVLGKGSRSSAYFAGTLNAAVNGNFVFSSPEEDLRIAELALDEITPEVLHEVFSNIWNTSDINLYLAIAEIDGTQDEVAEELKMLWLDSQSVPVDPPVEEEPVVWAYTDFGEPGTVIEDSFVEDLEIRQMTLSNNVKVNLKQTDFEEGVIRFRARFGLGQLTQPKDATYLDSFTDYVFGNGGLQNHTVVEIDSALTGKTVGISFGISQDYFSLSGYANPFDLEFALQLLTAHFVDPGWDETALGWFRDGIPDVLDSIKYSLNGAYSYQLFPYLFGGDERWTAPTEEGLFGLEIPDAQTWLTPSLESGHIELSIVGDFNETETVNLLLETIGAIPERDASPPEITDEMRAIDIPVAPQAETFAYESKIPTAGAFIVWRIPSFVSQDIGLLRRFNLLAGVFRDRMRVKIREELGGSYSPGASSIMSDAFEYGFFMTNAIGVNDEVEVFTEITLAIAANISQADITQDEFERALFPFQSERADDLQSNSYWLGTVMDGSQANPQQLDWSRGRDEFYEDLTVEEINDLVEYLSPDIAYQFGIIAVNSTDADAE
ncbi:Stromal processing peptidase, chloroplastic [Seminavis robusta]|uniref:Stromal processing peptidase, chloroplastic n=1 Tax=Seminavis robusta TaxID=568900 RepID=A0A9N8HQ49_9STRA|nr:Stromal processing peptidase, chloroplastic [Seminavis robusta]|eukprot:Sro1134_g244910.1 Stromal processing peptidase, chloroplastic (1074) ;mRNA; f:14524-17833